MQKPILEFKDISKSFGETKVLKSLNLKIYEKDMFSLVGRSGAGKSTLMKILIGYYQAGSGKIFYNGKNITTNLKKLRKIIGFTTQENSFHENLTVKENMTYYSRLYKSRPNIDKILKSVGLIKAKDALAADISGGMKRRLDFAVSLVHDPEILVLDEPTTGLDPMLVKAFWKIIKDINKKGKTIIVTSHIFSELEENCEKIGILEKGSFLKVCSIKKLIKDHRSKDLSSAFEKEIDISSKKDNPKQDQEKIKQYDYKIKR